MAEIVLAEDGLIRIRLDTRGNVWLGGNGVDGDLALFRETGDNLTLEQATIHLNGETGNLRLGAEFIADGSLMLFNSSGERRISIDAGSSMSNPHTTIHLDGDRGNLRLGGNFQDGDLILRDAGGQDRIRLDAGAGNVWLGGNGVDGDLVLFSSAGDNVTLAQSTIHLNGDTGDIILRNADCAEDFEVEDPELSEPGTVLVIAEGSRLRRSDRPYDRRVAGVVAGAGPYRPGIVLGRVADGRGHLPVALIGRIMCRVTDTGGTIAVGDLLTTSAVPGHAMKAADPARAFGAVLGKALAALDRGTGLIPVLATLQ